MSKYREKQPIYTVDIERYNPKRGHVNLAPGEDENGKFGLLLALEGHKKVRPGGAIITYPDGRVDVQEWDDAMAFFEPVVVSGPAVPSARALPEKSSDE